MESVIFTGSRAQWLSLYEELQEQVEAILGSFEVRETKKTRQWKHTSTFVEVSTKKGGLVVAFASDVVHDDWQPTKVIQTSKNRFAHYFEVVDNSSFSQLVERIVLSYHLTKATKPKKSQGEVQKVNSIEEYIALFDEDIQAILIKTRQVIQQAAPKAIERISWQMPTFYQGENLIHFAASKQHLGIYPGSSGVTHFSSRLTDYKTSKGAIQFPYHQPIPYDLIFEIVRFRIEEVESKK